MNALLPKFQTCLVTTHEAGFHPGDWTFVDKRLDIGNPTLASYGKAPPEKGSGTFR